MILQALVDYYEQLASQNKIPKPGWCNAKITFGINIDDDGNVINILDLKVSEQRGKKVVYVPKVMTLPEPTQRTSGVAAQFLWDNSKYILGFDGSGENKKAVQCFEATVAKNQEILKNCRSATALALIKFYEKWNPKNIKDNKIFKDYIEDLSTSPNITFFVNGVWAAEDKDISTAWNSYRKVSQSTKVARCLITGSIEPIERIHPMIKGIYGAQSSGASLVSFNANAFESYGFEQGDNAPVGKYAAFAYTTALNYLLSDSQHHNRNGDTTIVFWSEDDNVVTTDFMSSFLGNGESKYVNSTTLKDFFDNVNKGMPFDIDGIRINPQKKFYILGISPNAARLSIRFFLVNSLDFFVRNIQRFYDDFDIVKSQYDPYEVLPVWKLLQETANKNSKDKAATPILTGSFMRSILSGAKYPEALYQNIILRVKADQDNKDKNISKINRVKAAVIKAVLKRNYNNEEVARVALNEQLTSKPYVLGRLFSVLEQLQEKANPGINSTIKDRYFNSACATPNMVFPILMKLSNSHLKKINSQRPSYIYFNKQIGELLNRINGIPNRLTIQEQGEFILGYYHQQQSRYTKKEEQNND